MRPIGLLGWPVGAEVEVVFLVFICAKNVFVLENEA